MEPDGLDGERFGYSDKSRNTDGLGFRSAIARDLMQYDGWEM